MADPNPLRGMPPQLQRYWLGEGLARWATTPTPFRSLVAALRSEGIPSRMLEGLAAKLYHKHFGVWPGDRDGNNDSAVKLVQQARRK